MSRSDIWSLYGLASSVIKVDDLGHKLKKNSPKLFWPEHFLSLDIPNSRIFTWGFESEIKKFFDLGDGKNTLAYLGDRLLDDVLDHNWRRECPDRPIVFVAHSLGGLIVKKVCASIVSILLLTVYVRHFFNPMPAILSERFSHFEMLPGLCCS
jgi:hypothetical protein